MTVNTNSGLRFYMESARAGAKTISGITNADPGVVSSTAHGYSNGDFIYLDVQGMSEVSGRVFKVVSVATDSFRLSDVDGSTGIDTTDFGTFSSGSAYKLTTGTTVDGIADFSFDGGDIKTVDTTTVNADMDTQIVVGATAMSCNLVMQWDPNSAAQQAMNAAYSSRANKAFKVVYPNGAWAAWIGTVGFHGAPGGQNQGVTTSPAKVTMLGAITFAAS